MGEILIFFLFLVSIVFFFVVRFIVVFLDNFVVWRVILVFVDFFFLVGSWLSWLVICWKFFGLDVDFGFWDLWLGVCNDIGWSLEEFLVVWWVIFRGVGEKCCCMFEMGWLVGLINGLVVFVLDLDVFLLFVLYCLFWCLKGVCMVILLFLFCVFCWEFGDGGGGGFIGKDVICLLVLGFFCLGVFRVKVKVDDVMGVGFLLGLIFGGGMIC